MIINFLIICYGIQLSIFSVVIFKYLSGNSFKQIFLKHKLFKYFFPLTFMECIFGNQSIEYVLSTEYRLSENKTLKSDFFFDLLKDILPFAFVIIICMNIMFLLEIIYNFIINNQNKRTYKEIMLKK